MPKNRNWILVIDTETDGVDTSECNIVQLSAVPINPISLAIDWHAKNAGCSREDIIAKWKNGVPPQQAWTSFCDYCSRFTTGKTRYGLPIPAGYNIIGFDLPLLQRMADQYSKGKLPISSFRRMDLMDHLFWWFESLDEPKDYKLDTLREFFGLKAHSQAHDSLSDVIDTAKLIVRFMQFCRRQASVAKFKGAFNDQV